MKSESHMKSGCEQGISLQNIQCRKMNLKNLKTLQKFINHFKKVVSHLGDKHENDVFLTIPPPL